MKTQYTYFGVLPTPVLMHNLTFMCSAHSPLNRQCRGSALSGVVQSATWCIKNRQEQQHRSDRCRKALVCQRELQLLQSHQWPLQLHQSLCAGSSRSSRCSVANMTTEATIVQETPRNGRGRPQTNDINAGRREEKTFTYHALFAGRPRRAAPIIAALHLAPIDSVDSKCQEQTVAYSTGICLLC